MSTLIFIHGRAQEHKDAQLLKNEWTNAFSNGLNKQGLELPISLSDIKFPYYGQTLYDLDQGKAQSEIADVIIKGEHKNDKESAFLQEVLTETINELGITDEQIEELGSPEVIEKGPGNWEWVQVGLRAIDRFIPGASSASILLVTRDVYKYLNYIGVRDSVESGIIMAVNNDQEAVIVSHSLGTVVAYNILQREGRSRKWKIPLFLTLGSPLGITAIRRAISPIKHPSVVRKWFNAFDEKDLVALYPLDENRFPVKPSIENWNEVNNTTSNHHGISEYLNDTKVSKIIYDALTN